MRAWAIAAREPQYRVLLDRGVEDRAVVLIDGRPQRLILDRPDRPGGACRSWLRGDSAVARVAKIDRGLGIAFLDTGGWPGLTTPVGGLKEGQRIAGWVSTPARAGKHAVFTVAGDATIGSEAPGRSARPDVAERAWIAAGGEAPEIGPASRKACDEAEAEALQTEHGLPGGARLSIEPTRALIAVDVDVGASATGGDVKRRQRQANLTALRELPRLLRLKGLGGIVVIDLVGKGHDGAAIATAAKTAFKPIFGEETGIGPISRFGILQLQLPWLDTPVAELLLDGHGDPTPLTLAFRLLREIEREAGPGGRVCARCASDVFAAAEPYIAWLSGVIGARFTVTPDSTVPPSHPIVKAT